MESWSTKEVIQSLKMTVSNPLSSKVYEILKDNKFYLSRSVDSCTDEECTYILYLSVKDKKVRDRILNILSSYEVIGTDEPSGRGESGKYWSLTIVQDKSDLMALDLMSLAHLEGRTEFSDINLEYDTK